MKVKIHQSAPQLVAHVGLWLLERADGMTEERCRAYGGILPDGRIRTCEKRRWHWDSHAFDVDPHAYGVDRPVPDAGAGGAR